MKVRILQIAGSNQSLCKGVDHDQIICVGY